MRRHPRSRSRILGFTAATAVSALALTGCAVGGGNGDASLSDEDVTISFAWWGASARDERTRAAIDLFEKQYPNITVKPQSTEWGGYWDKLATTAAGGNAPDVMQFDQTHLSSYAQRGALADVDEYADVLDTSEFPEPLLDQGRVEGKLHGVPAGVGSTGVLVNTSVLAQYGVDLPDPTTWTWDDLTATALAVTEASGGAVHGITPFGGDMPTLTLWARQHGNDVYDTEGELILEESVLTDYWDYALAQIDSGAAPTASQLAEQAGSALDLSDIATGKTAFTFAPSALVTAYQAAAPDSAFDLVPIPADADATDGYMYVRPSMYWTVSSQSEHPAEAALLIDFLTSEPAVAKLFGTERGMPATPTFQEAVAPDLTPGDQIVADAIESATALSGDAPGITPVGAEDAESMLARYNQDVQFGRKTTAEAAKAYIDELRTAITAAS